MGTLEQAMELIRHALECYSGDSLGGRTEEGEEYYEEGKALDEAVRAVHLALFNRVDEYPPAVTYHCKECGGQNLHSAIITAWNIYYQKWEFEQFMEDTMEYWCRDCDGSYQVYCVEIGTRIQLDENKNPIIPEGGDN
jgi:hypothetical protein